MDRTYGFAALYSTDEDLPGEVEYRGQRFQAVLDALTYTLHTLPIATVISTYVGGTESIPYVVHGANLWFVNGRPNLDSAYPDPATDGPTLVIADVLHDFFRTGVVQDQRCVIRLEDVSVHIDPASVTGATDILRERDFPFVAGVIPNQRFEDGSIVSLAARPRFVDALRYAARNGATIALHGYHHTFGSGEDFEFWDPVRDEPISGETWDLYALKVEHGIQILRDQGLEPRLWETPHYAASPLAYQVFAHYFSHSIENREPASWLPYPASQDEYGQVLIPENIGYINPDEGWTVDAQLDRARLLQIVRDCWAVGFYHPASIPLSELESLATGLTELGFRPVDVGSLPLQVRFEYNPPEQSRFSRMYHDFQEELPWLVRAPRFSVSVLMIAAFIGLFLIRLRRQWQPASDYALSGVERSGHNNQVLSNRARKYLPLAIVVVITLVAGLMVYLPWGDDKSAPRVPGNDSSSIAVSSAGAGNNASGPMPSPYASEAEATPVWMTSDDWEISVYYTAVESYHGGPREEVRGCPDIECSNSDVVLGTYPSEFVKAVKDEGTGRITSGARAGMYLNWSIDVGYWLDSQPRDARGLVLIPYVSAAADEDVPYVTRIKIESCGVDVINKAPIDADICGQITLASWVVRDRFTVKNVGKHIDLYIGEEDREDFVQSSKRSIHVINATVALDRISIEEK